MTKNLNSMILADQSIFLDLKLPKAAKVSLYVNENTAN